MVLVSVLAIALAWFLRHANLADVWCRCAAPILIFSWRDSGATRCMIRAYRWQFLLH
jgi:hypothetical protein